MKIMSSRKGFQPSVFTPKRRPLGDNFAFFVRGHSLPQSVCSVDRGTRFTLSNGQTFKVQSLRRMTAETIETALADLNYDVQFKDAVECALVIRQVLSRFGSIDLAIDWYENTVVPGFGDMTPIDIVKSGRVAQLLAALNAIDAGVHA